MAAAFDRDALLDAFDQIGRAAAAAGTKLHSAVYGGSALVLASNFRFSPDDVDVAEPERPLPAWLTAVMARLARDNGWQNDWFDDGVACHLSALADGTRDHLEFGTFPRHRMPREFLTYSSPGEFAPRNLFTEERPLRRARGPRPAIYR